jgi:hypothetical protein
MITEVYDKDINQVMRYFGSQEEPIAHFTFNFNFIDRLTGDLSGNKVRDAVASWLDNMPAWGWGNWVVSKTIAC